MKVLPPVDHNGVMLHIGDYVKFENIVWEVVDHEDSEQPNYYNNATLLLAPRSCDGENRWVEDYDVEIF